MITWPGDGRGPARIIAPRGWSTRTLFYDDGRAEP